MTAGKMEAIKAIPKQLAQKQRNKTGRAAVANRAVRVSVFLEDRAPCEISGVKNCSFARWKAIWVVKNGTAVCVFSSSGSFSFSFCC